nr:ABC transporter ATP-binding protein [Shuttleworthia satelles]
MYAVTFEHVNKRFPGANYQALDDVSIQIEEGEFVTILGSSGCGKTTLIKMVNRLLEVDSGRITVMGQDIRGQDPVSLRRRVGYVIQQVGLFPHMTVEENIKVLPRLLGWDKEKADAGVDEMLSLVALDPKEFRGRYPAQLSGGQQQRVGLARALVTNPGLMLLDEPFGAIDAINRESLQNELKRIHSGSKATYLFVTHDIREALKLGSRVLIMDQGRVIQYDSPRHILAHPADDFVRSLLATLQTGSDSLVDGEGI